MAQAKCLTPAPRRVGNERCGWKPDTRACHIDSCSAPILAVPGQSEPSRKRPFVPIARLLPCGDRRVAPDKVASSRISPNLIRSGSVALARRWGAEGGKFEDVSCRTSKVAGFSVAFCWTAGPPTGRHNFRMLILRARRRCCLAIPDTASAHLRSIS